MSNSAARFEQNRHRAREAQARRDRTHMLIVYGVIAFCAVVVMFGGR